MIKFTYFQVLEPDEGDGMGNKKGMRSKGTSQSANAYSSLSPARGRRARLRADDKVPMIVLTTYTSQCHVQLPSPIHPTSMQPPPLAKTSQSFPALTHFSPPSKLEASARLAFTYPSISAPTPRPSNHPPWLSSSLSP